MSAIFWGSYWGFACVGRRSLEYLRRMKPIQSGTRHGLTVPMVRVKLRGFKAIDRRTVGAREAMAFRSELIAALGGEPALSPQRRRLVDMAARAALLLDHVDGW